MHRSADEGDHGANRRWEFYSRAGPGRSLSLFNRKFSGSGFPDCLGCMQHGSVPAGPLS